MGLMLVLSHRLNKPESTNPESTHLGGLMPCFTSMGDADFTLARHQKTGQLSIIPMKGECLVLCPGPMLVHSVVYMNKLYSSASSQ